MSPSCISDAANRSSQRSPHCNLDSYTPPPRETGPVVMAPSSISITAPAAMIRIVENQPPSQIQTSAPTPGDDGRENAQAKVGEARARDVTLAGIRPHRPKRRHNRRSRLPKEARIFSQQVRREIRPALRRQRQILHRPPARAGNLRYGARQRCGSPGPDQARQPCRARRRYRLLIDRLGIEIARPRPRGRSPAHPR